MPVGSHKAVIAGTVKLAGRHLTRVAKRYRQGIEPLIQAIKNARSPEGMRRALGPTLLRRMKTEAVATALADAGVQAALIGVVAAMPKGNVETSKRRNVETSKRRNVETLKRDKETGDGE